MVLKVPSNSSILWELVRNSQASPLLTESEIPLLKRSHLYFNKLTGDSDAH